MHVVSHERVPWDEIVDTKPTIIDPDLLLTLNVRSIDSSHPKVGASSALH